MRGFWCAVSLTNSFVFFVSLFFFFFSGYFEKVRLKMNCFSAASNPGHSNLVFKSYHFLMGKYTVILICFSQRTLPNASRFFFFFYLRVSSVEIGLGLYLNIYRAEFHFG